MATKFKGTKVKMTQIWKGDLMIPVTVVKLHGEGEISALAEGALVKVSGTSKGHGFAGTVKRHNFRGGPKSHGQKNRLRAPGSIGNTEAQRVIKGKRMAGHMGNVRVTVKNLKVVDVNAEVREIMLRGAVPGVRRGTVEIVAA